MSNKQKMRLARYVANLDGADQSRIIHASDSELPQVLSELGVTLPASSWWLVVIKIVLYALGLILAGIGTSATAQTLIP